MTDNRPENQPEGTISKMTGQIQHNFAATARYSAYTAAELILEHIKDNPWLASELTDGDSRYFALGGDVGVRARLLTDTKVSVFPATWLAGKEWTGWADASGTTGVVIEIESLRSATDEAKRRLRLAIARARRYSKRASGAAA